MSDSRRLLARVHAISTRDFCFWCGLAFLGAGAARVWSVGIGAIIVGIALFGVAVFGIASTAGVESLPPRLPATDEA